MKTKIVAKIKEEIEKLLRAGFVQTIRYVEWLANIVPIIKKIVKIRICIDFRDLNHVTLKDEYLMSIVNMMVDVAFEHIILSIIYEHSSYNQNFITEDDVSKMAFRCPSAIGTFEWVVLSFRLKNAEDTYQRDMMNMIFKDMIGNFMKVYIDDAVVKLEDLEW